MPPIRWYVSLAISNLLLQPTQTSPFSPWKSVVASNGTIVEWNRVWALGRDTYIRVYPNPGVGISFGTFRVAASWYGGFEVYKKDSQGTSRRTWSLWGRRK